MIPAVDKKVKANINAIAGLSLDKPPTSTIQSLANFKDKIIEKLRHLNGRGKSVRDNVVQLVAN